MYIHINMRIIIFKIYIKLFLYKKRIHFFSNGTLTIFFYLKFIEVISLLRKNYLHIYK